MWDQSKFKDILKTKTLFLQEMFFRGILILGSHNITLSHDEASIERIKHAYEEVLSLIQRVEREQSYEENLLVKPLEPLFRVR